MDDHNEEPEAIRQMRDFLKVQQEEERKQYEKMVQADELHKTEFVNLLDSLNAEQLGTVRKMIQVVVDDKDAGYQLTGLVTGALVFKHGRSWSNDKTPWSAGPEIMDNEKGEHPITSEEAETAIQALHKDERQSLMDQYNVVPNPEADGYFMCGGCGLFIHSLEDRMLREPGIKGCEGCQQKAKFG